MAAIAIVIGVVLIAVVLWDAFETIILPRRISRRLRLARIFYRLTWQPYAAFARRIRASGRRESFLSFYGPISLILLLGVWAFGLMLGFALVHGGLHSGLETADRTSGFGVDLYMSGTTLFTLGLGDVVPHTAWGRASTVAEAGTGFAFLALVIGYLPTLYQAFSRREASIATLDARAGSPPSAVELLLRYGEDDLPGALAPFLQEWERWSAELLESQLSFPILAYYHSQHDNQSWIAALTMLLDLCALALAAVESAPLRQARLTFAMARHAAVDLSQITGRPPAASTGHRSAEAGLSDLRAFLGETGIALREGDAVERKLAALRSMYEPYMQALASYFLMELPPWLPPHDAHDDWQVSAWERDTYPPR